MTDFTPTNPLPSLLRMLVTAGARHALTGLGGFLVASGAITGSQTQQFVEIGGGIIVWLAGYAWSAANKKMVTNAVDAVTPVSNSVAQMRRPLP